MTTMDEMVTVTTSDHELLMERVRKAAVDCPLYELYGEQYHVIRLAGEIVGVLLIDGEASDPSGWTKLDDWPEKAINSAYKQRGLPSFVDALKAVPGQLTPEQFMRLCYSAGRISGPDLLLAAWWTRSITSEVVTAVITEVWALCEYPSTHATREVWLKLFGVAGYTVDGRPAARPTEPMRLYRGCTSGRTRQMSWTTDRDKAKWFADRFGQFADGGRVRHAYVYQTDCPPGALLGLPGTMGREDEHEVIINPAGLKITRATS